MRPHSRELGINYCEPGGGYEVSGFDANWSEEINTYQRHCARYAMMKSVVLDRSRNQRVGWAM